MTERKLRIGSLFAGVGGFDLGFERAGFETAWAVEIDEKAQAVLRLRFPKAELHDDVTKVGANNLGPVDVITYGFPCQDLSVAGKRAGLDGQRSGLFHEAVRVIRELRARDGKPDIAIAENVPGLFSSNAGRDFAVVLQTLVDVGARDVAWRVLDSQYFAVAQRRKRVFIVSDFGGERAAEILSLGEGVSRDSETRRASRQGSARGARASIASGGRVDGTGGGISGAVSCKWSKGTGGPSGAEFYNLVAQETVGTLCSDTHPGAYSGQDAYTGRLVPMQAKEDLQFFDEQASGSQYGTSGVALTCSTRDYKDATDLVVQPIAFHPTQDPISSSDGTIHSLGCGSSGGTATGAVAIPFDTTQITSPLNRSSPRAGDTGHPLAAQAHAPAVALEGAQRTGDGTLSARTQGGGGLGTDCELDGGLQPVGAMAVRRLTPTETARLQGFPDDWNAHGLDRKYRQVLMKDGNRYKQMGNAVTVNVAQAIAERVAMVLGRLS